MATTTIDQRENQQVQEQATEQVQAQVSKTFDFSALTPEQLSVLTPQDVILGLQNQGHKRLNSLRVKSVSISERENQPAGCSFSLKDTISGYTLNRDLNQFEYSENVTSIFVTLWSVMPVLKQNDDLAAIANALNGNHRALELILSDAKLDIIQQRVSAGEEFVNYFTKEKKAVVFTHDTVINHLIRIELGANGSKYFERILDKILTL